MKSQLVDVFPAISLWVYKRPTEKSTEMNEKTALRAKEEEEWEKEKNGIWKNGSVEWTGKK